MVKAAWHLGAHRCATTTFQAYLDLNREPLAREGLAVWTPNNTRNGLFQDLFSPPECNGPEVQESLQRVRSVLAHLPQDRLLVSEENMIGAPAENLDSCALYPDMIDRLLRYKAAFAGHITRIGLSIRSYESYWASLLSFAVWRGYEIPTPSHCSAIANQIRTWRLLIAGLRDLFPTTPIHVWRFEDFANNPEGQLRQLVGPLEVELSLLAVKKNFSRDTHNLRRLLKEDRRDEAAAKLPAGQAPWMPFDARQQERMRLAYAQDLTWLKSSTDPFITFHKKAATNAPQRSDIGDRHEFKGQMGRIGRQGVAWQTG